ncbi:MAG: DUF2608 domain-containing protein [Chlamydiales bacterium]|nr:DUF2608 domain-containing protein [Chlamydiales bacterium]
MRIFFLLLAVAITPLFAHVIQTDSFELLEASIPDLTEHDLVIFDYSNTLAIPTDALLQSCSKEGLEKRIFAQTPSLGAQDAEKLISLILLQRKVELLDSQTPEIIRRLNDQNVKVIVLTSLRTGPYGYIPFIEQWRLEEIYSLGLDFRRSFPQIPRLDFKEFRKSPSPPVFIQGVFCTGSISKGEALKFFFKRTGFKPRRMIFVDNTALHHNSVEKCARRLRIPYLGYYYTKGACIRKNVDEQIANFQIHTLIETGEWIDDLNAERRIKWTNTPT